MKTVEEKHDHADFEKYEEMRDKAINMLKEADEFMVVTIKNDVRQILALNPDPSTKMSFLRALSDIQESVWTQIDIHVPKGGTK